MKQIILFLTLLSFMKATNAQFQKAMPPVAEKKEHIRTIHSDSVPDNYYWMYDYFGKGPDSTKVVNYLTAENAYLDTVMAGTKTLQENLYT
jgi:oligopeptidase B